MSVIDGENDVYAYFARMNDQVIPMAIMADIHDRLISSDVMARRPDLVHAIWNTGVPENVHRFMVIYGGYEHVVQWMDPARTIPARMQSLLWEPVHNDVHELLTIFQRNPTPQNEHWVHILLANIPDGLENQVDAEGNTPLHQIALLGSYTNSALLLAWVEALAAAGANPYIRNKGGLAPLDIDCCAPQIREGLYDMEMRRLRRNAIHLNQLIMSRLSNACIEMHVDQGHPLLPRNGDASLWLIRYLGIKSTKAQLIPDLPFHNEVLLLHHFITRPAIVADNGLTPFQVLWTRENTAALIEQCIARVDGLYSALQMTIVPLVTIAPPMRTLLFRLQGIPSLHALLDRIRDPRMRFPETLLWLFRHCPDEMLNARDGHGLTPLHRAVEPIAATIPVFKQELSARIVDALLRRGADAMQLFPPGANFTRGGLTPLGMREMIRAEAADWGQTRGRRRIMGPEGDRVQRVLREYMPSGPH